jgi:hypothetical protein
VRVQKQIGADSLDVLLVSVDRDYGELEARTRKRAREIFTKQKLTWPNVCLPGGWDECAKTFNLRGYGLSLVDAKGIVRGIGVRPKEIKRLLKEAGKGGG